MPVELSNQITEGGICLNTKECKGDLECINGLCSKPKGDPEIPTFLISDSDIYGLDIPSNLDATSTFNYNTSNRGSTGTKQSKQSFVNPINQLVKSDEENDGNVMDLNVPSKDRESVKKKAKTDLYVGKGCDYKSQKICSKICNMVSKNMTKNEKDGVESFLLKHNCCSDAKRSLYTA